MSRSPTPSPGRVIIRRMVPVVVIAAALVTVAIVSSSDKSPTGPEVSAPSGSSSTTVDPALLALQDEVDGPLFRLAGALEPILRARESWRTGELPDEAYAAELAGHIPDMLSARADLDAMQGPSADPRAIELYRRAIDLYVELVRVDEVATTLPLGDVRHQDQLLGGRVRVLADRVYDRAHARLVGIPTSNGAVEVRLPDEVPSWTEEGLAPGPPLAPPPAPPSGEPSNAEDRPEQSVAGWEDAVVRAGIPSAPDLGQAITTGDAVALEELAGEFQAAESRLRATADPAGGRERANVVRLALLVYADAARAGHAADLLGPAGEPVAATARRLAVIGDLLWDPDLPRRDSGFPATLLR